MAGLRDFQQGGNCHRKTWINVLLGVLQLVLPYVQQGGAQLQALTQMSGVVEVWQAEDADFLVPTQAEEEGGKESLPQEESSSFYAQDSGRSLRFQPLVLEFGTQLLGLPRAETVYIHNPSQEVAVTMLSLYTSSRHLHIPPFHRRVIPPRGKTSFKVIFLPTEEGNIENSLFINTSSHGLLSYQVFGVGIHSGPLVTAQIKNSVVISPHIHSIKLTQTQEGASNITILGLLLECHLPESTYRHHHPQGSCFLTEEKLSVQISLSERGEKRADLEKLKPYVIENIVVLFVLSSRRSDLREPRITIYMLNSGDKKLYVKEMQLLSEAEGAVEFKQVLLKASATNFTQVATLLCKGSSPTHRTKCSSQISLHVLGNSTLKSYPALDIMHGFRYDASALCHVKQSQNGHHYVDLWLTNSFDFSFSVNEVTLHRDVEGVLKVTNFSRPVTVPWGCWKVLSLRLNHRKLPVNVVTTVVLVTSIGLSLEIPLRIQSVSKQGDVVLEASAECRKPCPLRLPDAGHVQWLQTLLDNTFSWKVDSGLATELCTRWKNSKDQLTCSWPRLPVETSSPVDFGATPVNERKVKYFMLKNPTASPLSVEVRTLSSYPAPLEALDLLTKWFNISPLSINVSTAEFALLQPDGQESGDGTARLVLQPRETVEMGVAFTPAEHKPVTSVVLIRNNLTVFDMVLVRGHGARELLRVGGKLPGAGASLRFNVPQSTLMECRDGLRTNKPLFAIRKSFKVENAGELPLTVMSMNINGYQCQGFGFEVLQCRPFHLDHNSSTEINIAFTPDFTSSWVIRDLTLVTERGSSFPFTLNVTLPHHMLPLCAQVVPGPSWEETFWVVTLIFTCCSLGGVCLMAFHQAQYILTEFSQPGPRTNHSSALSRDNSPVNPVSPSTMSKMKGSCKAFVDSCNSSDKGKGKGSPAVAGVPTRGQSSSKKSSGGSAQPQKKHKVSVYYAKYKVSSTASAVAAEGERDDPGSELAVELDPDTCNNNNNSHRLAEQTTPADKKPHFTEAPHSTEEDAELVPVMFPMETQSSFPGDVAVATDCRPGLLVCSPAENAHSHANSKSLENREATSETEPRGNCDMQRRLSDIADQDVSASTHKGRKSASKSHRKTGEGVARVPERSVAMVLERNRDQEWRESRNTNRTRNRCCSGKPDAPKLGPNTDSPLKQLQNGVCPARPRRKGVDRRPQWESGSDSGSSSGSVRASRGSWGSWSSASSLEGERDHSTGVRHHCTTPARTRDNIQCSVYPADKDCYQTLNSSYKAQSIHSLYRKEPCQTPDPAPLSAFTPSFSAITGGLERNMDITCPYLTEEAWSAPSIPLTNEFRYNTTEPLPFAPHGSSGSYNGFPWSNANSHCTSSYSYCDQNSYVPGGNDNFQNNFSCQESQNVAYTPQAGWGEDGAHDMPSAWNSTSCVGNKGFFSGTRSLSPMSGLFGSIWTPQSEPYQNHFQLERSVPPSPQSPFRTDSTGTCRPGQFSSFNPFGPHMNLDIWNSSSSNRSSNSQLSNDSGYCGDV
ncbi:transmembrane protein 131-like [Megalops cyprinoides]|uniref:transmembrane protein 131-like n=1 Tax=Megalops cyprinoides TaxID=118141 RepID=UPI00186414DB|nr:transmembrane protein 131-like [Megalops cyprinoides]